MLGDELVFRNHKRAVIAKIDSGAMNYGVLAAGVYWIHLDHVAKGHPSERSKSQQFSIDKILR